jgi:hypothetical protein
MKKHIEILFIKVAIWILMGRNLTRCMVVSRRDNNDMWYMAERLESIVQRMGEEYRAGHYGNEPDSAQQAKERHRNSRRRPLAERW